MQDDGNFKLKVKITNSGQYAGKEVVQVYAPVPSLRHQLIAFGKTRLLQPGESQTLEVTFALRDMAYFDEQENAWVLDAGDYPLEVASNARDVRQTVHVRISSRMILGRVSTALR